MKRIAIIGLSNVFPGSVKPELFWENLLDKVDSRTEATPYQMGDDPNRFYKQGKGQDDKYYCQTGGYIHDFSMTVEGFDLSQATLDGLDDVFKWSLYVAREALKDSKYQGNKDILARCGVLLGNLSFPTKKSNQLFLPLYHKPLESALKRLLENDDFSLDSFLNNTLTNDEINKPVDPVNGLISGYPAALIAKSLGLGGINLALDAACASSLYSVKLACDYLNTGKADLMLAGAVSAGDPFFVNMGFSIFQAYPENGVHAPLDVDSQGLFAGEGAGMLVLKRYDDAINDGDHIYATICAGGLSNDGKGQHVLSPNTKGQVLAYERAYADAEIDPTTIDFVECHATGTPLGDKVEVGSMETYFGKHNASPLIGSVKSNLGHLLTAAGMPGILKIIMGMKHGKIPATINVNKPQISKSGSIGGDKIPVETVNWPVVDNRPKRAASSVFGFGGCNAHVIYEEHRPDVVIAPQSNETDSTLQTMAIVGMDALFGNCVGLDAFEQTVYEGRQHFIPLPEERWKGIRGNDKQPAPEGAYIENFEFDFMRFKVPPKDEDALIPQQLLTMKVIDGALQDAGIKEGSNVAVLVALSTELELHQFRGRVNLTTQIVDSLKNSGIALTQEQTTELEEIAKDSIFDAAKLNRYTSFIGNIMAARISSLWDFSGPSFSVSSEENSVFKCVDLAQNLLSTSDVEAVVVAAVDLSGSIENVEFRQLANPLNDSNQSMSFDSASNGWSIGEGAGAVVLKRVADVIDDKQTMYCQIDGIGFSSGVDANAVSAACAAALQQAGRSAGDIGYVEAFASGNTEEDNQEIAGLSSVFGLQSSARNTAIGSVKANIGHTYTASGIASLIKTALCLRNRFIPGVPNWHSPQNQQQWDNNTFYIQGESKGWITGKQRCASISSLGADETAAHVVLSEASHITEVDIKADLISRSKLTADAANSLVLAKGKDQQALLQELQWLIGQLKGHSLNWVAAASFDRVQQSSKTGEGLCIAFVASSIDQLRSEIKAAEKGVPSAIASGNQWFTPNGSTFNPKPLGPDSKTCFVYPGGFASYPGLGKDIFRLFPEMEEELKSHTSRLGDMVGDSLFHPRSTEAMSEADLKQLSRGLIHTPIAMFESGICYSKLLTEIICKRFKVKAHSAIGYSMGEISMMYAMDVWGSTDRMSHLLNTLPVFRTRLAGPMDAVREAWSIDQSVKDEDIWAGYTVKAAIAEVEQAVSKEEKAFLILINTANEAVIAGDPDACARVVADLDCENFVAPMSDVIHCDIVKSDADELSTLHRMPIFSETSAKLFSAVGYQPVKVSSEGVASNLSTMYCNQVDFPRLVNAAYDDGARVFIELGPRDTCTQYVQAALGQQEHLAVAIDAKGRTEKASLVRAMAALATHQIDLDLSSLFDVSLLTATAKRGMIKQVKLGRKNLEKTVLADKNLTRFTAPVVTAVNVKAVKKAAPKIAPPFAPKVAVKVAPKVTIKPQPQKPVAPIVTSAPKLSPVTPAAIEPVVEVIVAEAVVEPIGIPTLVNTGRAAPHKQPRIIEATRIDAQGNASLGRPSQGQAVQNNFELTRYFSTDTTTPFPQERATAMQTALSNFYNNNANNNAMAENTMSETNSQIAAYNANLKKVNESHEALLESRQIALGEVAELMKLQIQLATGLPITANTTPAATFSTAMSSAPIQSAPVVATVQLQENYSVPEHIVWDTADLVEFAEGKIGNVFGPEYSIIDTYSRRVRLPTTDYLLVTRVTKVEGTIHEYKPCTMTTEYDIPTDAPYLVGGQIPWAVAVESGQCDLLLISYLGIDFTSKGNRVYRLLDCTLTFMDDLAFGGETLRYDISINNYANNGDALLFFFSYECFVGDKLVLKMDGGCAGFFTDEELADGKGVIKNDDDRKEIANAVKQQFTPFLTTPKTTYEYEDMRKLIDGDTGGCFGPAYDKGGLNPSLCFASEKFLMIERVTSIQPTAGAWGLGIVEGEKHLDPNHWYFPCHFKDDQVMAGSLMAEGCGQLLMFYMLHLGLHTQVSNARFQPMPGEAQQVRCRGQVQPQTADLVYRMEVTEIGLSPYPYAKANVDIILNGKVVVDFKNISVMLKEQDASPSLTAPVAPVVAVSAAAVTSEDTGRLMAPLMQNVPDLSREKITGVTPIRHFEAPVLRPGPGDLADNRVPDTVPYQPYHMFEFATGDIAKCFGNEFAFYKDLTPPRTPCGDLQLTTRITEVRGKRGELKKPSYCRGEYEVPADAWYFTGNSHPGVMPYSVLMEISLQPNGFVSAWAGTTLRFPDKELFFRNLDGAGELLREVDLRGKTIINDSNLLSTTIVGSNIVQSFDFTLSVDNEPFYKGTAVFGYFEASSLKDQLGLDKGQVKEPWHVVNNTPQNEVIALNLHQEPTRSRLYNAPAGKPHYRLAGGQLDFIDRVDIVNNGGKEGKGYIFAEKTIDPTDWFFSFHFHEDPVMPGSLGVEAIIEAMQVYALENDLGANLVNPMFSTVLSKVKWKYRGQINPLNVKLSLDIHITDVRHEAGQVTIVGDASLSKDGLRIYEVADIVICLKEA